MRFWKIKAFSGFLFNVQAFFVFKKKLICKIPLEKKFANPGKAHQNHSPKFFKKIVLKKLFKKFFHFSLVFKKFLIVRKKSSSEKEKWSKL